VLNLTRYEFRLLKALLAQPGRVYSRDQLMTAAWEEPATSLDRMVDAHIYSIRKRAIDLRIYVTDTNGRVIYDSDHGTDEGKDYSKWRDVRLSLAGEYGARGSRAEPGDDTSLVIHVDAPIQANGRIVGSLSVGKPTRNINELVAVAKRRILWAGLAAGGLVVFTGFAFSVWLTTPIERLTAYARAVRDGKPATLPRIAGREVTTLRQAFDEMREALEGKKYVERYTQTLTHEIKAPPNSSTRPCRPTNGRDSSPTSARSPPASNSSSTNYSSSPLSKPAKDWGRPNRSNSPLSPAP